MLAAAVDDRDSGNLKLLTISMSTKKLKDDDQEDELHVYFVVASIAAIERNARKSVAVALRAVI